MADAATTTTSTDYLPQMPRDRADSNMSLGAGITLLDNSAGPSNGAASLASPTAPPDPTPPATKAPAMASSGDDKIVQEVLTSEVNYWHTHGRKGISYTWD